MKKLLVLSILGLVGLATACGDDKKNSTDGTSEKKSPMIENPAAGEENPTYDPKRGEGKFSNVEVGEKLDAKIAEQGQTTFGVKCASCHKLTDEKLVGPGLSGVTERRTPDWIMNFITNPDAMLDKDPEAQAMLEICLVRMPDQNLADDEARNLLEFLRKNDGVKP